MMKKQIQALESYKTIFKSSTQNNLAFTLIKRDLQNTE
jgi:hypothetical protein